MDSGEEDSGLLFSSPVIIVPAANSSQQCQCRSAKCKACGSPVRGGSGAGRPPVLLGSSKYDPANYLARGGGRAADKARDGQLARLNKAALQDLQVASSTLAHELVRLQTHGTEEKQALQAEVARLELLLQAQQDKLEVLTHRLADALRVNEDADARHHARLKEVARRLKESHHAKLRPLQEAHHQLLAELQAKQQEASQLQQAREQLSTLTARLEVESASRAELWQRCNGLQSELAAAHDKLAATSTSLHAAEKKLVAAAKLQEQLAGTEAGLQAERAAHMQLQAETAVERGQATAARAEVDRLHRELTAVSQRTEQAEAERAALRQALASAEAAVADAGVDARAAHARAERLAQELESVRREAEAAAASLRSQAAVREERMLAEAANTQAQLQAELDMRTAAAADSDAALAAARGEVTRLAGTVESLRHMGDAAGAQLASAQARIDMLKQDKQELEAQVKQLQVHAMQQEAAHAELLASQQEAALSWQDKHQQLQEASAKEQQQLQQAVAKWRAKAMELQDELEVRADEALSSSKSHAQEAGRLQAVLDAATAEAGELQRRLAAVEEERAAAAKRSSTLMTQWEAREKGHVQELSTLRSQLNELMAASSATQHEADAVRQQLASKHQQVEQLAASLADEQARVAALRGQMSTAEEEKAGEVEGRLRQMQELSAALQAEQRLRLDLQMELTRAKKKQTTLEGELQQQKSAASQLAEAKARAEEAAASAAAALAAAERRSKQYRVDSASMLSDYDSWVQGLLAKSSSSGSGGTAAAPAAADARSLSFGGSPRNSSRPTELSSLSPGSQQQQQQQQQHDAGALERADRIAAMLDSRAVPVAGLSRALSGKASPASGGGRSVSMAATVAAPSPGRLSSPRPVFR